jgi:hypothetical protein
MIRFSISRAWAVACRFVRLRSAGEKVAQPVVLGGRSPTDELHLRLTGLIGRSYCPGAAGSRLPATETGLIRRLSALAIVGPQSLTHPQRKTAASQMKRDHEYRAGAPRNDDNRPENGTHSQPRPHEYLVPTHADVPVIDVAFVEERDETSTSSAWKASGHCPCRGSRRQSPTPTITRPVRIRDLPICRAHSLRPRPASSLSLQNPVYTVTSRPIAARASSAKPI